MNFARLVVPAVWAARSPLFNQGEENTCRQRQGQCIPL